MNLWEKLNAFLRGGITWSCPRCKEKFYARWKLEQFKQKMMNHMTSMHGFSWDDSQSWVDNLSRFTNMQGGQE